MPLNKKIEKDRGMKKKQEDLQNDNRNVSAQIHT